MYILTLLGNVEEISGVYKRLFIHGFLVYSFNLQIPCRYLNFNSTFYIWMYVSAVFDEMGTFFYKRTLHY